MASFRSFTFFLIIHDSMLDLVIEARTFRIREDNFDLRANALKIFATPRDSATGSWKMEGHVILHSASL